MQIYSRLLRDRSGGSAAIIGLTIFAVLGFAGLSIEVGQWYLERRTMQSATDSAALAAGYVMYEHQNVGSGVDPNMLAAARRDAERNGYDDADPDIDVNIAHVANSGQVTVTMTQTENNIFASFFMGDETVITRRAVASVAGVGEGTGFCMLGLSPTCPDTVKLTGTTNMTLTECPIVSNSCSSGDAAKATGSAAVDTPSFSVCGSFVPGSGTLTLDPTINGGQVMNNAQPVPDPLRDVPECKENADCWSKMASCSGSVGDGYADDDQAKANPLPEGCYNGMTFKKGAHYFLDGDYYVSSGDFELKSGQNPSDVTVVKGDEVTIHLSSSAQVNITKGEVYLSAPAAGTYEDILFFQSRDGAPVGCNFTKHSLEADKSTYAGTIYIPNEEVKLTGNPPIGTSTCTRVIAQIVEISGSNDINIDCTGDDGGTLGGTTSGGAPILYQPPKLIE